MITYRKLKDTLVGTINGKPFNMPRTEDAIKMLDGLQENCTDAEVQAFWAYHATARNMNIAGKNKYLTFNPVTHKYYLHVDDKVSKHPIPEKLVTFIEDSYDKDIDFMPVVKAWANLLNNPRYNQQMANYFETYLSTYYIDKEEAKRIAEEQEIDIAEARKLATYQDIAITKEGLLATYKVAEEVTWKYEMEEQEDGTFKKVKKDRTKRIAAKIDDVTGSEVEPEKFEKPASKEEMVFTPAIIKNGDRFYSGDKIGYVYEIGKVQYLPKDAKRNLNNTSGGGGLYSGGLHYIENYRGFGTHVLTCFVNPRDILSFQSEGHAIRVDALMPYNVWDEEIPLKGTYHSSEYGKLSNKRVDEIVAEAVEKGYDLVEYQANAQGDKPENNIHCHAVGLEPDSEEYEY